MGVYFKEEPIREPHRALEGLNFRIVYPNDREDLLKRLKITPAFAASFSTGINITLSFCEEISKLNVCRCTPSPTATLRWSPASNDLRMQVRF